MISRLTRPIKRLKEAVVAKANGFANPIKKALFDLRGKLPSSNGFAGSEDLAEDAEVEMEPGPGKAGLMSRLKSFKKSLKEMSDLQKIILLTIAVCLPAGILISSLLVGFIKKRKKK